MCDVRLNGMPYLHRIQVRPNRQTLLFSATFKRRVEALARTLLKRPVRISVGTIGASSSNLTQVFGKPQP